MPLSPKQLKFITEYMTHGNATQAATVAGYGKKSAASKGSQLLRNVKVQTEITQRIELRRSESEITVQGLLKDLVSIKNRCMEAEPILDKEGNQTGEWKFDSRGALKAVEMLGKHLGMFQDAPPPVPPGGGNSYGQPIDLSEASTLELMEALFSKGMSSYGIRPQATEISILPTSTTSNSPTHPEANDDE